MSLSQEIHDILKSHAQLIQKFALQTKPEEIAKGESAIVDTAKELNVSLKQLEPQYNGPELERHKVEVKHLIRTGLILIKSYKSNGSQQETPEKIAFQKHFQIWKQSFVSLRDYINSRAQLSPMLPANNNPEPAIITRSTNNGSARDPRPIVSPYISPLNKVSLSTSAPVLGIDHYGKKSQTTPILNTEMVQEMRPYQPTYQIPKPSVQSSIPNSTPHQQPLTQSLPSPTLHQPNSPQSPVIIPQQPSHHTPGSNTLVSRRPDPRPQKSAYQSPLSPTFKPIKVEAVDDRSKSPQSAVTSPINISSPSSRDNNNITNPSPITIRPVTNKSHSQQDIILPNNITQRTTQTTIPQQRPPPSRLHSRLQTHFPSVRRKNSDESLKAHIPKDEIPHPQKQQRPAQTLPQLPPQPRKPAEQEIDDQKLLEILLEESTKLGNIISEDAVSVSTKIEPPRPENKILSQPTKVSSERVRSSWSRRAPRSDVEAQNTQDNLAKSPYNRTVVSKALEDSSEPKKASWIGPKRSITRGSLLTKQMSEDNHRSYFEGKIGNLEKTDDNPWSKLTQDRMKANIAASNAKQQSQQQSFPKTQKGNSKCDDGTNIPEKKPISIKPNSWLKPKIPEIPVEEPKISDELNRILEEDSEIFTNSIEKDSSYLEDLLALDIEEGDDIDNIKEKLDKIKSQINNLPSDDTTTKYGNSDKYRLKEKTPEGPYEDVDSLRGKLAKLTQKMANLDSQPVETTNYSSDYNYESPTKGGNNLPEDDLAIEGYYVDELQRKIEELKSQMATLNPKTTTGPSRDDDLALLEESELALLREEIGLGDDWKKDPLFTVVDEPLTPSDNGITGLLESDLELLGINKEELATMSVDELEKRIALLEEEFLNDELDDELQRLAKNSERPHSKLSPEELEALLSMDDEDIPTGSGYSEEEVIRVMNDIKKTNDADAQLQAIQHLAKFAQADAKSIEVMDKEGLVSLFPSFFKTKGPQFLAFLCNIISSIHIKSALRLSLATSQMITFLMETYKMPQAPQLSKASEDALIKLSQKNGNLPLILQLLTSDSKNTQDKAKHKLKQTCAMFSINSNTPSTFSNSTPTTPTEFLAQLGSGHLSPAILLGLTDEQMMLFLPLIIKDTQNAKPLVKFIKNWAAFLHRVQLSPNVGTYFYWLGSIEGIFKRGQTKEGDISVFCRTKELEDTEAFFQRFTMYWDKLGSGYSRDNLNLVDPISGRRMKTIKTEQRKDSIALNGFRSPLELTMGFHSIRQGDEKSDEKGRISLWKGIDIRGTLYLQTILNICNSFWTQPKQTTNTTPTTVNAVPEIKTYRCIPITKTFGCIELIEPTINFKTFNWQSLVSAIDDIKFKFLASLAGAVTISWILGFRDKIEDFLFIHNNQIIFLGIDKINLWNAKPIDSDFIIKIKAQTNILTGNNNGWNIFQNLCSETFKSLHEKGTVFTNICSTLYTGIYEKDAVEEFISGNKSLMLNAPLTEALGQYQMALNDTGSLKDKFVKTFFKKK